MRVGFEVIAAGTGLEEGAGGAAGYIEGLLPRLADDPRVDSVVAYVSRWYEGAQAWRHPKLEVRRVPVPKSRPPRVAYEQAGVPLHAARDGVDVLFSTGNYRPLAYRGPNVLALHAVQHFLLGGDIGRMRSAYLRFAVPRSARTADITVAVTEALRRDAIRLFDLDPSRIVSVPMGPSPWTAALAGGAVEATPYRTPDGSPYVLCISRLYALKNHRRLIEAFAQLAHTERIDHSLVIVGGDADVTREELAATARTAGVADRVVLLGRVAQSEVPGLYAGADLVAYVSLYETFGHPVLEAFATGRPLVTSRTGGTAEVAGGAARLVDPEQVADIAAGLHEALTDEELRNRLVQAGRRRLDDFSWEKCAAGTVDALVLALERRAGSASRNGDGGTLPRDGEGDGDWARRWHRGSISAPRSQGQSAAEWQEAIFDRLMRIDPMAAFGLGPLQRALWAKRIGLARNHCDPDRLTIDVGSGNGIVTRAVAERPGGRVVGIDVSGECVRYAASHNAHPLVSYHHAAIEDYQPPEPCGLVVLYEVLEHVDDPGGALRRVAGWLAAGGHLVLSTPNRSSLNRRIKNLAPLRELYRRHSTQDPDELAPGHVDEYPYDDILAMVRGAGLEVTRTLGAVLAMPFPDAIGPLARSSAFARLNVRSGDWSPRLAADVYVVARRSG